MPAKAEKIGALDAKQSDIASWEAKNAGRAGQLRRGKD